MSGATSVSVADVVLTPADARSSEAGHQVQLNAGSNAITVTVRAQNCTPQSCTQDGPYTITVALTAQDYDDNENGLIDIRNLAQLNAIRWDLDGNGVADASANNDDYAAAFGRPQPNMGCEYDHDNNPVTDKQTICVGYELRANLDFDTGAAGDRTDDAYYNGGAGWTPIGGVVTTGHPFSYDTIFANSISPTAYSGRFNGNGHTISNLSIVRTSEDALGLFGAISGHIEQVGLVNPSVVTTAGAALGPLVGYAKSTARVTASYAQGGEVRGGGYAGGLVGYNKGAITVSYADVAVRVVTPPPGQRAAQPALRAVGGLVGANTGTVTYSYAIGKPVNDANSPVHNAGGLIGLHDNTLSGRVANSYWDTIRTGQATSAGLPASAGLKTYQLRAPTDYGATSADLYYGWNLDLNNDGRRDDPWEFGTATQYPALQYDGHGDTGGAAAQLARQPTISAAHTLTALSTTPALTFSPAFSATNGGPYLARVPISPPHPTPVNQVTVNYTPDTGANVVVTATDADTVAAGLQIDTTTKGRHPVTIAVSGDDGSATTYTLNLEKGDGPVANAGPDKIEAAGATVTLNGSGAPATPAQGPVSFAWTQIAPTSGAHSNLLASVATNAATLSFTAPSITNASDPDISLRFRLTVTDAGGLDATDEATVTVTKQATVTGLTVWRRSGQNRSRQVSRRRKDLGNGPVQ